VPVALDRLITAEFFTLRGRKTGDERFTLMPIANEMECKSDPEASGKADEKTCPEHNATPVRTARIQNNVLLCTAVAILRHGNIAQLRLAVAAPLAAG
jgi:hypothetical protein